MDIWFTPVVIMINSIVMKTDRLIILVLHKRVLVIINLLEEKEVL